MKSEPDVYGIDHLQQEHTTLWDGIRNYQARNFMRSMAIGDQAFFYHSNCKPPGIIGLMEVSETGLVDPTQFDPSSKYHDPASKPEAELTTIASLNKSVRAEWGQFIKLSKSRLTGLRRSRFCQQAV